MLQKGAGLLYYTIRVERTRWTNESGVAVVSVAQALVENKMGKKKHKGVGLHFYRFQNKEAQRNGMTTFLL